MSGSPFADLDRPPLDAAELRRALVAGGVAGGLDVVEVTGSTNADLVASARRGPVADRTILVAEHQQSGRGRLDRRWETPPRAGLTLSVLLRPDVAPQTWTWVSLLAGVALAGVLRRVAGLDAGLKWPNDVLVPAATSPGNPPGPATLKVAGLLGEIVPDADRPALVLGIGLNVTSTEQELPPGAASVRSAGGACTDRTVLLKALVRELVRLDDAWRAEAGDAQASGLAAAARQLCVTIGTAVIVHLPGGRRLPGFAEGIDGSGRLLVRSGDTVHSIAAGDIEHVRASA